MQWLAELLAAILTSILKEYGDEIGTTKAKDAQVDRPRLVRAGLRVRDWLRARGAGDGKRPDAGGA